MAIRLTYGNVGTIPTIAEFQNMQRYQEILWLGDLDSNQD